MRAPGTARLWFSRGRVVCSPAQSVARAPPTRSVVRASGPTSGAGHPGSRTRAQANGALKRAANCTE
jgi:hypothetical protein